MHVHEADLAAEEGRALGALEVALRPAVVGERPVEQARAVGAEQVLVDEAQVVARLLAASAGRRGSRGSSRSDAVAHAGRRVARVSRVVDAAARSWKQRVAGEHVVGQQQRAGSRAAPPRPRRSSGVAACAAGRRAAAPRPAWRASGGAASRSRRCTCARASPGRPAAASRSSRRGRRRRARCRGSSRLRDQRERALDVLPHGARSPGRCRAREERDRSSRIARVAGREQVLRRARARGQKTMSPCESPARIAASRSKNMNHCGQSPSGFCALHHAQQQVAHRLGAAERQQQLDRALADVARAPAAAGELLEAARREVVDERVLAHQGRMLREARDSRRERRRRQARHRQAAAASAVRSGVAAASAPARRHRASTKRPTIREAERARGRGRRARQIRLLARSRRRRTAARRRRRCSMTVLGARLDARNGLAGSAGRARSPGAARTTTAPPSRHAADPAGALPSSPLSATWMRDRGSAPAGRRRPRSSSAERVRIAARLGCAPRCRPPAWR